MTDSIAVIIPCYNSSSTLNRAIDSIINQSVEVIEIIVVDDHSDDYLAIQEICYSYGGVVKYVNNKKNIGLAASRNVGISNTKSNIVTFLDSDDQLHHKKIELQLKYLTKVNVVSTEANKISNQSIANLNADLPGKEEIRVINSAYKNLFFNRLVGASLMAYTSTLKKIKYDSNLRSVEDFDLWLRLLNESFEVVVIKLPLYYYYDTEGSLSKNSYAIWENIVIVIKKFINQKQISHGSIKEQFIWVFLLSKELIKSERLNNKDLKNQLSSDIPKLVSNKLFVLLLKVLIKLRFYKVISFLLSEN